MNLQTGCGISPSPPTGEIGKESRKWRLARRLVWSIMGWPRRSVNMPNLYEIFNNAHDGEGMTTLGREFGLTQTQTEAAVTALLPAISTGLKQSTATVDGLGNLFGVMGQHVAVSPNSRPSALIPSPSCALLRISYKLGIIHAPFGR